MTWIINTVRFVLFVIIAVVAMGCESNWISGPVPEWAEDLSYSITCSGSETHNRDAALDTPYAEQPVVFYDYDTQPCEGQAESCTVAIEVEVRELDFNLDPIVNDRENDQKAWLVLYGLSRTAFDLNCRGSVFESQGTPFEVRNQAFGSAGTSGRLGVKDVWLGDNDRTVEHNEYGNNNPAGADQLQVWLD